MTTAGVVIVATYAQVKDGPRAPEVMLLCCECRLHYFHSIIEEERLAERDLLAMFSADATCDRCGLPLHLEEDDQDDE